MTANHSFHEIVLEEYLHKRFPDILFNYKSFVWNIGLNAGRMEYDCYIPSLKLAIEYDGERYHREDTIRKDIHKNNLAKEHDIVLLRIRETKCPAIEGYVINTENTYTLQKYQDMLNNVNDFIENLYSVNSEYVTAFQTHELYKEARKTEFEEKDFVHNFCNELSAFFSEYGKNELSTRTIFAYGNKETSIGHHLTTVRTAYKENLLSPEDIAKIEAIYPECFDVASIRRGRAMERWINVFEMYQQYCKENGSDVAIPYTKEIYKEGVSYYAMNAWIRNTKDMYNNNQLPEEIIHQILELKPDFFENKITSQFDRMMNLYKEYIHEKGTSAISVNSVKNENMYKGVNLGSWVFSQKQTLIEKYDDYISGELKDNLAKYKIESLLAVVPEKDEFFKMELEKRWEDKFEKYKKYQQTADKSLFSDAEKAEIYKWSSRQKKNQQNGTLDKDKYDKLVAFESKFFDKTLDKIKDNWNDDFEKYKNWCIENNTFNVPISEKNIYTFVSDQQHMKLKLEKEERTFSDTYKSRFAKLLAFNPDFFATNAELKSKEWINLYKKYIFEKGTTYISSTTEYNGEKLGGRITKDASNYANAKDKFNPESKYYLKNIIDEYNALVYPHFSVSNMEGLITRPTALQKEYLSILGKTEMDAPTKEYTEYYLNNIDNQRKEAGLLSLKQLKIIADAGYNAKDFVDKPVESVNMSDFRPKSALAEETVKEVSCPTAEEIDAFKANVAALCENWPRVISIPNGIARIQIFASDNNMNVFIQNGAYYLEDKNNSVLAVPLIETDSDKTKKFASLKKVLPAITDESISKTVNNLYETEKTNTDIIHKMAVWFTQTDEITPDGFTKICADNGVICNKNFLVLNDIPYKADTASVSGISDTVCNLQKKNSENVNKLKEIKREFGIKDKIAEKQNISMKMKM